MSIEKCADSVFESVRTYLEKRLQDLPAPRDGKDGADGVRGEKGLDGAPGLEGKPGEKGLDGTNGRDGVDGAQGEKGIDGTPGRDGIDGKDGAPGLAGTKGLDGEPGRDGRDGPPGRDAAQIDILPAINEERSYARGTFASHKGGLWRAMRATEGVDGWECIVEGVSALRLVQGENARAFVLEVEMSSGAQLGKSFFLPAMIYRGVFSEGERYDQGDTVTWGGSLWHCNESTKDKPLDGSKSWVLCAKKGRDGKDGAPGTKGDKGIDGRTGRDLTQMLDDGRKF